MSDAAGAQALAAITPNAFRQAQDLLVAAQKLRGKAGFFSSQASRERAVATAMIALDDALDRDNYFHDRLEVMGAADRADRLVEYLSRYSDAFPNWQEEYGLISQFVAMLDR